jgi:hypothetical protein
MLRTPCVRPFRANTGSTAFEARQQKPSSSDGTISTEVRGWRLRDWRRLLRLLARVYFIAYFALMPCVVAVR